MENLLNRADAPFSEKTWNAIDSTVVGAARSQLSARRLLYVEGPYGLGLKVLPGRDSIATEKTVADNVRLLTSAAPPVVAIETGFRLSGRDIAAFETGGVALDLGEVAMAAINVARQEDALIFNGSKGMAMPGLLNAKGTHQSNLKAWSEVGAAVNDIIEAVVKLDTAGFHGPYALALAPERYNLLFRRYPQDGMTELEHAQKVATDGVIKAPALQSGGVLIATGPQFASIVLGQDIMAGFVGPAGRDFDFTISETVALRLLEPASVCVLKQA